MIGFISRSLRRLSQPLLSILVFGLIVIIGAVDYLTGFDMSVSFFYLAPIALAAWYVDTPTAVIASFVSNLAWLVTDILTGPALQLAVPILVWNMGMRLGFFLVVALLLSSLRRAIEHEKLLARTDFLTGMSNSRAFFEQADIELERARRYHYPVSVAYIDLDNFKALNDFFGHYKGDEALKALGVILQNYIRQGDIAGRLGGDEFAILFPRTGGEEALAVSSRLHETLTTEIGNKNWPVSLSMGVLTCQNSPAEFTHLMIEADKLMYEVKRSGKNSLKHKTLN